MTGRFETLVYTDCRPGQGLLGSGGLQFQARSAGADDAAMTVVQRALLYEPPATWMRERRPVADYPPSFAHIADGCWATAQGVYLGREANGSREGNQLTHSVITNDPDDYGLVRPAQLFGAQFWTSEPIDGTACPPVEDLQPGPFDASSIQEFVAAHADGARLLGALVTTLQHVQEPQARRLLFVADMVEPVLRWLTAATLLIPHRQALDIGFKVFTTNPGYAAQPVLAVHPDWDSSTATVDNDLGYVVVDLLANRWSEAPISHTAAAWAQMFITEDPYDVMDAVEVAAASQLQPAAAQQLAVAAVLRRPPAGDHAPAVVSWLDAAPPDLLEAYGGTVVEVLAEGAHTLPVEALRSLDGRTRTEPRYGGHAAAVRLGLLAAEAAAAGTHGATSARRVPPLPAGWWDSTHAATARRIVADGLDAARGAGFDAILQVALRFEIHVPVGEVRDAADAFVADWVNHPERPYDPVRWPWPENSQYVDLLCDHLARRVHEQPGRSAELGSTWWRLLRDYIDDADTPLNAAVLATAMAASGAAERHKIITDKLYKLGPQPERVTRLLSALWDRTPPTPAELEIVRADAPTGTVIDPAVIDRLLADRPVTGELLRLVRRLEETGLVVLRAETAAAVEGERRIRQFCRNLPDAADAEAARNDLTGIPADALVRRRRELAEALDSAPRQLRLGTLAALPVEVVAAYADRLAEAIRVQPSTSDVAMAFCILGPASRGHPDRHDPQQILFRCVRKWVRTSDDLAIDHVAGLVRRLGGNAGPDWLTDWRAWVQEHQRGRRWLGRRR
jgi:hypothetical protein